MEKALVIWSDGNQLDFDVRTLYNIIPEAGESQAVLPIDAISYVKLNGTELIVAFKAPLSVFKQEEGKIQITSSVSYKIIDTVATYLRTRKQVGALEKHGIKVSIN